VGGKVSTQSTEDHYLDEEPLELTHIRGNVRGIVGHQMDPRRVIVATAPGRLAVDGAVRGVARPVPSLEPLADTRFEVRDVDPAEDSRVGGLVEAAPPGEPQELKERPAALLNRTGEGFVAGPAGEHGDDGQRQKSGQGMAFAPGATRIAKSCKEFHQGGVGANA
jgi:hypothetical protein